MKRVITIVFYSKKKYDYILIDEEKVYLTNEYEGNPRYEYSISFIYQPSITLKIEHIPSVDIDIDFPIQDEINIDDYFYFP